MSASLTTRVRRTLLARDLLVRGEHVVAACSGGPDSTAMLYVLASLASELGFTLAVASVDHGLRDGSAEEVRGVGTHAQALGLPFHPLRVTLEVARGSLQERARARRYAVLLELARAHGNAKVAVGHTRDDQAETVVSRLLRGSSVSGLGAIMPRRADGVIRPLIDCAREDVEAFVARQGLVVVHDPSNHQRSFERVRIREHLLPEMRREDANLDAHLASLADDARSIAEFLDVRGRILLEHARMPSGLDLVHLRAAHPVEMQAALCLWVRDEVTQRLNRAQREALAHTVRKGGEVRLSGGWIVERIGEQLVLVHDPSRSTRSGRSPKK